MTQPPDDVFRQYASAVTRSAEKLLDAPWDIEPHVPRFESTLLFFLCERPSLAGDWHTWFLRRDCDEVLRLRKATWHRDHVSDSVSHLFLFLPEHIPPPEITVVDVAVPQDVWQPLLARGQAASIPAVLSKPAGICLDGTNYRLQTGNSAFSELNMTWCCDGPPQWRCLVDWVEVVRKKLDDLL